MLDVDVDALGLDALDLGGGDLAGEEGVLRVIFEVCSPLADSSAANGVTAGFPRGMVSGCIRLSCIEILHFSERFARRCWKN